jgi:hypothetical protein
VHRTTSRFWKCLESLPVSAQTLARKNFLLLKENPKHPSLHFKKVGKFWSARVGINYRAIAVEDGEDFIWVWIGTHEEYDRLLSS